MLPTLAHRQTPSATPHCYDHDSGSNCSTLTKENTGFVYRRPLLVNQQCIEDRHFMGMTLSLIILFNLALAHHLLAISELAKKQDNETGTNASPPNTSNRLLQQALRLYEFAYELFQDYHNEPPFLPPQQPLSSRDSNDINDDNYEGNSTEYHHHRAAAEHVTLTMIVTNNVGEIHRVAGNPLKHKRSLHHLLSLMMFVLVDKSSSSDLVVLDSKEMDGFYHNLIPIILDDVCAPVAMYHSFSFHIVHLVITLSIFIITDL